LPLPGGRFRLAWLLPIAVDAYAVTATRVWLRTAGTARTRGYARRNAIGAIGLSVAGNATYHALGAAGVASLATARAGWLIVVAVSAVPPVMLGLVGHLHALVSDDRQPAPAPLVQPTRTPRGWYAYRYASRDPYRYATGQAAEHPHRCRPDRGTAGSAAGTGRHGADPAGYRGAALRTRPSAPAAGCQRTAARHVARRIR
jgi:hypothetical protein